MIIKDIFAYKTTTKSFQPRSRYLDKLHIASDYAIKILRESKKEFDTSYDKNYKILNRPPTTADSYTPRFIYIKDEWTPGICIFDMDQDTFTTYQPIYPKKNLGDVTDFTSINKIMEELYEIKSRESYPLDRNVYSFDDIGVELYIDYYEKCYSRLITIKSGYHADPYMIAPVIIMNLKTYGQLQENSLLYPKYMSIKPVLNYNDNVSCCTIM